MNPHPLLAYALMNGAHPRAHPCHPQGETGAADLRPAGHVTARPAAPPCAVMADRLTPLDASFLHTETASAHMHVAWRGRFRPGPDGRPSRWSACRRRSPRGWTAPRASAAASPSRPGASRIRCGSKPSPSTSAGTCSRSGEGPLSAERFDALSDTVLSRPLDRMHPLWEIHLAPHLEDGTVGLLMKIHHALVDGKSALAVALLLLDLDPEAPEPPAPDARHAGPAPGAARLAVGGAGGLRHRAAAGARPRRARRRLAHAASAARCAARRWRSARTSRAPRRRRSSTTRSARAARSSATRSRSASCSRSSARATSRSTTSRSRSSPARCASSRCCGTSCPRRSR